ncbi:MAG: hypothetical protein Q4A03_02460 [Rothia sp. (in: high G+C Gram-positive bacteria)]|uniref:hypothetical protein n=1 Tax=Rothia sp. (in: high G+C Gram-positive bacteria) TaxID=1885016 RepID=UPI0026FB6C0F|nr:hypothetical protein [Rothia sp. (in: high G+C Gram-positive bacteria)]
MRTAHRRPLLATALLALGLLLLIEHIAISGPFNAQPLTGCTLAVYGAVWLVQLWQEVADAQPDPAP